MLKASNKFYSPTLKYKQTSRAIKYPRGINRKKATWRKETVQEEENLKKKKKNLKYPE